MSKVCYGIFIPTLNKKQAIDFLYEKSSTPFTRICKYKVEPIN